MKVSGLHGDRLKCFTFDLYSDNEQRAYVKQEGLTAIAQIDRMAARLHAARDRARRDAIKNLARYKFSNFGYHAARWVTLNAIIGDRQPNPFKAFVALAREEIRR